MAGRVEPGNRDHALWVEGPTDRYFLYQLFNRRGVQNLARFHVAIGSTDAEGGWTRVRDALPEAVRGHYQTVAAVFDADGDPAARWQAITTPLRTYYPGIPGRAPSGGYVAEGGPGYPRLGLWMMPDNAGAGMLETYCRSLIPDADALLLHASTVVDSLPEIRFTAAHRPKALIHSWLSWQVSPGHSLGQALMSGALDHAHANVDEFIAWINQVFPIQG